MNELTDKIARDAKPGTAPYRLVDGGGLFLLVNPKPAGSKLWRLKHNKTMRSLGSYPKVTLKQARDQRDAAKRLRTSSSTTQDTSPTLRAATLDWLAEQTNWGAKHHHTVSRLLEENVLLMVGDMQMAQITKTILYELVVKPFEARGVIEQGERALKHISKIFDRVSQRTDTLPDDYNPARFIQFRARKPVKHFAALTDLPAVRDMLRVYEQAPKHAMTALANRMMALTAMRTFAIRHAEYDQFDLDADIPVWLAPASIMKGKTGTRRPLTIPLAPQAVEVVLAARRLTKGKYLFGGREPNSKMSENTLLFALDDAGYHEVHSPHGWRSSFSTIMNERHRKEGQVIDFAIGHKPRGTRGIYNRADYLERRYELAIEYADLLMDGFASAYLLGARND